MLNGNEGPLILVDRLIFDQRNKTKHVQILPSVSPLPDKINKENLCRESYFFISANQIKIIRLTFEDLNKNETNRNPIDQHFSSIPSKLIKTKDKNIFSPVYESIDGRRDSIDFIN